ncbi:hypothetical protein SAMN05444411_11220 [Lutibacter oricola]|uniref:Glycosyl transferase family 8 n=1 Tax=Lutibacter oricola TaxID=762486 RepID=A0A1H3FS84_9FLAO|nr:hypothetical protein [Lutibacter oricola]SDX93024.1 hypothetical protein SAMN05444411_11220 [Lutibacter oricola]
MKRYFVTFSNLNFDIARKRITKEAEELDFFENCFSFGEEILSDELKECGLLKAERGFGYWSWKPDVILKAFETMEENDMLAYVDAGCYLYKDKEWDYLFSKLENHDMVLFNIPNKVINWTKKSVLDFFEVFKNGNLNRKYLVAGGILFLKKNKESINFLKKWKNIMVNYPELLYDVREEEFNEQIKSFREHRHDQSLLTQLAYRETTMKIAYEWENFESKSWLGQAIFAARSNHSSQLKVTQNIFKYTVRHFILYPFMSLMLNNKKNKNL